RPSSGPTRPGSISSTRTAARASGSRLRIGQPAVLDSRELSQLVLVQTAASVQMEHPPAADDEPVGDQAAVAAPPLGLRAHDRNPPTTGLLSELLKPGADIV